MACLAALVVAVLAGMAEAWLVMVLLGAFHHGVSESIPALGFWWVLAGTLLLRLLGAAFRSTK